MKSHRTNRMLVGGLLAAAAMVALLVQAQNQSAQAQAQDAKRRADVPGITRQAPNEAVANVLLDPNDTVLLLLDHQTGLFQTVKDIPIQDLRNNTVVLAKMAEHAKVPIFTTASVPEGPNGPLMEELAAAAPNAKYIPRKGEVSSWDNADFVKAVEGTGRKTLVIAGMWTSVCVAFPALQAKAEGYKVYAVIDASGDLSEMASRTTLARLTQGGVIPVSTNVIAGEFQRSWNRPDATDWAKFYGELVPNYRAVGESYKKAQDAAKELKK